MIECVTGMMAKSLAGHDKNKIYMVLTADEDRVHLVDGKYKTIEHPKMKKRKHVQIDTHVSEWIRQIVDNKQIISDSDVIKAIRDYQKQKQ